MVWISIKSKKSSTAHYYGQRLLCPLKTLPSQIKPRALQLFEMIFPEPLKSILNFLDQVKLWKSNYAIKWCFQQFCQRLTKIRKHVPTQSAKFCNNLREWHFLSTSPLQQEELVPNPQDWCRKIPNLYHHRTNHHFSAYVFMRQSIVLTGRTSATCHSLTLHLQLQNQQNDPFLSLTKLLPRLFDDCKNCSTKTRLHVCMHQTSQTHRMPLSTWRTSSSLQQTSSSFCTITSSSALVLWHCPTPRLRTTSTLAHTKRHQQNHTSIVQTAKTTDIHQPTPSNL